MVVVGVVQWWSSVVVVVGVFRWSSRVVVVVVGAAQGLSFPLRQEVEPLSLSAVHIKQLLMKELKENMFSGKLRIGGKLQNTVKARSSKVRAWSS